jgi:hypothetical protein
MDQGLLMGHGRWPLGSSLRLKAVGFSHSANTSACLPIPMHSLRCTKGPPPSSLACAGENGRLAGLSIPAAQARSIWRRRGRDRRRCAAAGRQHRLLRLPESHVNQIERRHHARPCPHAPLIAWSAVSVDLHEQTACYYDRRLLAGAQVYSSPYDNGVVEVLGKSGRLNV